MTTCSSASPQRLPLSGRAATAPSVLPLLAASLFLCLCSFALGRLPAPLLAAAQALLSVGQALLVAGLLRLRKTS